MQARYFLVSFFAFNLCFQLLRFPHLILENGGGAFLILFFLVLNLVAFPLLVAEKVLDSKLNRIDFRSLLNVNNSNKKRQFDHLLISLWYGLRVLVLVLFLWFFLYLGSSSLIYLGHFFKSVFALQVSVNDVPNIPQLKGSFLVPALWCAGGFLVSFRWFSGFLQIFTRWVLPFCFLSMLVLFLKVLYLVDNFDGLKLLFYPDFFALKSTSLLSLVGHSMASLFIGFGFYNRLFKEEEDVDTIEIFIRALILAIILAVVVGVMALPMIDQVSETPFGSNWIFEVLPRWVSYGEFGSYYCSLFYLSLSFLSLFVVVVLFKLISENLKLLINLKRGAFLRTAIDVSFFLINTLVIFFLQKNLTGWSGQSLLIMVDDWVFHFLLPLFSLVIIWVMFRYTNRMERLAVFEKQQVFYHNSIFYSIWEKLAFFVVPTVIVAAWLVRLL